MDSIIIINKNKESEDNMIDIKLIRENKELVKENLKKKFQEEKTVLVDEIEDLDIKYREFKKKGDDLRALKNSKSAEIGALMREGKKDLAEKVKEEITKYGKELEDLKTKEEEFELKIREKMMNIPNIIDSSVPIGKDDSENVELERFGEPLIPNYEIPYHADIINALNGMDKEAAGRTSGEGFYYLLGDVARIHEAMLAYARDYMIDKGFTYAIPPFMIHSSVVEGVMSFPEMEAMMYKIEGEDLYLIGTSEHSMIGKFKDQMLKENELPITMTSYSPCFRKEGGSHGLEERGLYRVHQFEKQEMIVICDPKDSMNFYEKMWRYTVEIFRNFNVPVRQLECCSGDLADLKVKSCDIEAWSPRQQKYFEVGSCSTLGDAQARRLGIRVKGDNGNYYPHTLNNTVVATPRGLIALIENNYNEDGSVTIPEVLRPYMGGKEKIENKLKDI
jgi:seryl-tRNA synthetase